MRGKVTIGLVNGFYDLFFKICVLGTLQRHVPPPDHSVELLFAFVIPEMAD